METRKIQEKKNGQFVVTIPRDLAKAMGMEKGEEVGFTVQDSDTLQVQKK